MHACTITRAVLNLMVKLCTPRALLTKEFDTEYKSRQNSGRAYTIPNPGPKPPDLSPRWNYLNTDLPYMYATIATMYIAGAEIQEG